jgi:beta-lactamase regulating signal transducer with metallopeptidase domain/HEAT repeat protein
MTVQIVGWALIHSLWQGVLIAALLGVTLTMLRKAPAAWRHLACVIALVAMPAAPLLTSIRSTAVRAATPALPATTGLLERNGANAPATLPDDARTTRLRGNTAASLVGTRLRFDMDRLLPWLVAFWLFGVVVLSLRVIGGYVRARRLVRLGTAAVATEIAAAAARIAHRLRVTSTVRVLESVRAQVPMVIGLLRPVVLMPASLLTGLTMQQIEAILAHELAHVRRYDYAINLVQTVIETFFFYHPAMWWLSRRLRDEREQACDELAVAQCGGDPIFYSRVLLTVEEWRRERIAFAPAATGGSLSLRIRKLIGEDDRKLDVGPRWFAGVVTVAAALFATGSLLTDKADAQSLEIMHEERGVQDTARARPASVQRFSGAGSAEQRWEWARQTARAQKLDRYWVGYIISGAGNSEWIYQDRGSPVQIGDDTWMSGHMRFDGDFKNVKFSGVALNTVIGDYSPNAYAVFLAFDATSRNARLVRVRLANFVFPMHFNRWPLLWLDEITPEESVRVLAGLRDEAASKEVLGDLPSAVGAHRNSTTVVPVLLGWLNDRSAPRDFRVDVMEALAEHGVPEALGAVSRIARSGEDEDFRAEAIEALADMPLRAAADTLITMVGTLTSERLRAEAVESLGERPEEHVAQFLEQAARADGSRIRMEAIEAIAELSGGRGTAVIGRLAEDATLAADARKEAVEALAEIQDPARALETLSRIIFNDTDTRVQIQATETLGELNDPRSVDLLARIALTHPMLQVQIEATEALGEAPERAPALAALERIAATHAEHSVRVEALEAMGEFSHDDSGAAALMKFLRGDPDEELAIAAVEALADVGSTARVVGFIGELLESNRSIRLKIEALEVLEDLPGDAGLPLLEKYTRSNDRNLRAKALEILADRQN